MPQFHNNIGPGPSPTKSTEAITSSICRCVSVEVHGNHTYKWCHCQGQDRHLKSFAQAHEASLLDAKRYQEGETFSVLSQFSLISQYQHSFSFHHFVFITIANHMDISLLTISFNKIFFQVCYNMVNYVIQSPQPPKFLIFLESPSFP